MNVGIYSTPCMTQWVADVFCASINEAGRDCVVHSDMAQAVDDDLTIIIPYGHDIGPMLEKGRGKYVAYVNTEQTEKAQKFADSFRANQAHADIVIETAPELMEIAEELTHKPVIEMPLGYHESMDHTDIDPASINVPWDVTLLESMVDGNRVDYHRIFADAGINAKNPQGVFDLMRIARLVRGSKICAVTHSYGTGSALSTFRVIGLFICNGAFVLSQRAEYPYLVEDKHIVYFDTREEMVEKMRYYLDHQDEAHDIGNAAYRHTKEHNHMTDIAHMAMTEIEGSLSI